MNPLDWTMQEVLLAAVGLIAFVGTVSIVATRIVNEVTSGANDSGKKDDS